MYFDRRPTDMGLACVIKLSERAIPIDRVERNTEREREEPKTKQRAYPRVTCYIRGEVMIDHNYGKAPKAGM
jgi:hypothetical protein